VLQFMEWPLKLNFPGKAVRTLVASFVALQFLVKLRQGNRLSDSFCFHQ
jgi:hypothetical protein